MTKIRLSEHGIKVLCEAMIKEAYEDKIRLARKYLDQHYVTGAAQINGKNLGVFVVLSNGIPTEQTKWEDYVIDDLDDYMVNTIKDHEERKKFCKQAVHDWYYKSFTKYGNFSKDPNRE